MKLIDYVTSVATQSGLAESLGVTVTQVHHWAHGDRPVPASRCPDIELATNSMVTCEELRPDVNWPYLRGTKKKVA